MAKHFLTDSDVAFVRKLKRESGSGKSRVGGPRRTRRIGGSGGGAGANIQHGRIVTRVDRNRWIWNPEDPPADTTNPPPNTPAQPPNTIENPEAWKNHLPKYVVKSENEPQIVLPDLPDFPIVSIVSWPRVGYPIILGEVSVVCYELMPLPTKEELGLQPEDPFPTGWPPPWPDRYWESMELQVAGDLAGPAPSGIPTWVRWVNGEGKPHPHLISNPDWTGPGDPDASGEPQFLANETRFVREYWTNPHLVPLKNNMWVTAINKEIISASPTTFQSFVPRTL